MNRLPIAIGLATLLGVATLASAQQTSGNFADTYGVLSERNIFLRERHRPRRDEGRAHRSDTPDYSSPAMVEKVLVLRGVAIEDDELHAYVENTHTGEVLRLGPGDNIASGKIAGIAIDAIAYAVDSKPVWVEIGENLAGARAEAPPPTSAPAAGPDDPGKPAPLPPGGGTLEERMKARRAQQLQKSK